jgi:superfamily II DNA or RNA helicase
MIRFGGGVKGVPMKVGALAIYKDTEELRAMTTFQDRFGETVKMYTEFSNNTIGIPRGLAPVPVAECDYRSSGTPTQYPGLNFKPRNDRQVMILNESIPRLQAGRSFIIQAGTGTGKTVLTMPLIASVGTTALIVVDQDNIKKQWEDKLINMLGLKEDEIGYVQGDTCLYKGKKVVIAMLQSLAKMNRYPPDLYDYFGLMVIDEVHVCGADMFSNVMNLVSAKLRLGLSATPERKDGRTKLLTAHIGNVEVISDGVPLIPKVILAKSEWECPKSYKRLPNGDTEVRPMPHSAGKCMHVIKHLSKNNSRNTQIANFVGQAYQAGRNIVVFSDLREGHSEELARKINYAGVPTADIGFYLGGMNESELDTAAAKRVVITTYKMTAKAVDCPWWDTAVFATPRSDIKQIAGRVLREYEGKCCARDKQPGLKEPILYDLCDMDSPVFRAYLKGRAKYYREMGCVLSGYLGVLSEIK